MPVRRCALRMAGLFLDRKGNCKARKRLVERVAREAEFAFDAHPHMLRHACGYALANKGHDRTALQATSATATSSTQCDTLSSIRRGLRIFGVTDNTT